MATETRKKFLIQLAQDVLLGLLLSGFLLLALAFVVFSFHVLRAAW